MENQSLYVMQYSSISKSRSYSSHCAMSSLLLPLFFSVVALVSAHPAGLAGNGISLLAQTGDDNEFDPSDLSFIKKLAAIGDSYSAGIGAGDRLGSVLDALDSQGGGFFTSLS